MGWQSGEGTGTGGQPAPVPDSPGGPDALGGTAPQGGTSRDERLSGFASGGQWDQCPPGPELAAVLTAVGGPEWRCPGAEPDELIGVVRRLAALESWASAAKLAAVRELIRQDEPPSLTRPRHGDLPDQWSDSLSHELALAFAVSVQSAEQTTLTAWELGARLPGIAALHADGTLAYSKARLIVKATARRAAAVQAGSRQSAQSWPTWSSRWPPCSASRTGPAKRTDSESSTRTCAATSPGSPPPARTAGYASRSPTPMASPSVMAAGGPGGHPARLRRSLWPERRHLP